MKLDATLHDVRDLYIVEQIHTKREQSGLKDFQFSFHPAQRFLGLVEKKFGSFVLRYLISEIFAQESN